MKCIKLTKQSKGRELGDIMRTNDIDAELRVKGGRWSYIPKSEWKLSKVKVKKPEQETEQVTEQIERKPYKKGSKSENKSK